jgi:hypothetical protein
VIARVFEEAGLTTVSIVLNNWSAEHVKPPRALFMPFPYGYALGKAEDAEYQHRVLEATFGLLDHKDTPVLAEWTELPDRPVRILQASRIEVEGEPDIAEAANEVTALRNYYERWLEDHDGRSAVGLCGVPQRRFRGLIRFLEAYSSGEENADSDERPADMPLVQFIRYAVEDLKAFAYESRMCQRFGATEDELHTWFWGQTSLGQLVRAVATRMGDTDDEPTKVIAQGIAR